VSARSINHEEHKEHEGNIWPRIGTDETRITFQRREIIMSDEHAGYIWDIKKPTKDGYVACLVITPVFKDGKADIHAKMERNMGRSIALQIADEMLSKCGGVPNDVLAAVSRLRNEAEAKKEKNRA
jgi:hypothetical protein